MMNRSRVLQHIEMLLGIPYQVLEISEDDIMKVIKNYTLPTYSKFYPLYIVEPIDTVNDKVEGMYGMYYINTDLTILGISKLVYQGINLFDQNINATMYRHNPLLGKIQADVNSSVIQPVTFEYHAPNIVELFPKNLMLPEFSVELKVVHPEHLNTIPENMHDEFLNLAAIDVFISLYPIRHRFQSISTTFGEIELFMDKLESARDDRKEILENWRTNFFKNSKRRKIFVY